MTCLTWKSHTCTQCRPSFMFYVSLYQFFFSLNINFKVFFLGMVHEHTLVRLKPGFAVNNVQYHACLPFFSQYAEKVFSTIFFQEEPFELSSDVEYVSDSCEENCKMPHSPGKNCC